MSAPHSMFDSHLKCVVPYSRYLVTKFPGRFRDPATNENLFFSPPSTAIELTDEVQRVPADPVVGSDAEPDTPVDQEAVQAVKETIKRGRGRKKG